MKGAASFKALRTVNETTYITNKDACVALGLLADDSEWKECLSEAAVHLSPKHLRQLFATILHHNQPTNPLCLWDLQFDDGSFLKNLMSDDFRFLRSRQQANSCCLPMDETDIQMCLHALQDELFSISNGNTNLSTFGLPIPNIPCPQSASDNQSLQNNDNFWKEAYASFNEDQLAAFQEIDAAVEQKSNKIFFVNAVGGTGKTFLFNALLAKWRANRKIVHAVASTGIAALLLQCATTVHSGFKVPLVVLPDSSCSVTERSQLGKLLKSIDAIIWDEAPMSGKHVVDCVDRLLRGLTGNTSLPFGGKIVVFGGDFRQTLPVVGRQGRAGIVSKTMQKCEFWSKVRMLSLNINERVRRNGDNEQGRKFSDFLLQVGEGKLPYHSTLGQNIVKIPDEYVFASQCLEDFIRWCYPDIDKPTMSVAGKAILAPKNSHVDELNQVALSLMQGDVHHFESADSIVHVNDDSEAGLFPTEYLNSINSSGLPPHLLTVKIGSPLLLIRNLNPKQGLCNGTRLVVKEVMNRLLKVEIMNGSHARHIAWIPRIDHLTAENFLPFTMNRRQFPVKLAFAMTINKSQGQTLQHTGLWLPEPVFAHGQLYVALSRSGIPENTKILMLDVKGKQGRFHGHEGWYTKNVVYQEVIT